MRFTGKEILESKELQEFLVNSKSRVLRIEWNDGSITNGSGKDINIENVETFGKKHISVTEGLWSKEITNNMALVIEDINNDLYKVYTTTEAAIMWGKDESTVRKAIANGKFERGIDYRKAGRITLITRNAMLRVYGEPK